MSLRQFVQRNDLGRDEMIISVPSQNSFARFVNLPPVETKRIPEIVKFEAVQQIPFDINDVQWDWQMMTGADSPEKKVGIFAIKNEVVNSALEHFNRENLQISYVQMVPMALYNYLVHDRPDLVGSDDKATVVINIGAESTDLVVCTKSAVWQRCILIGGNAFTKAIADTFRLSFEKAEKLKRTAPVSKYARQIFQAMRPVFTDLASEVQRSLGFYTSSNPNVKFSRIVALGGGTKLRGLLKYLQQTLQIPVERPDSFKKLAIASNISAAKFHENVCDFAVVYGLALQALGTARIGSNLLPRSIARSMAWASKTRYFNAAACLFLLLSLMCMARTVYDRYRYARNSPIRQQIDRDISSASAVFAELSQIKSDVNSYEQKIEKAREPFQYRSVMPELYETIISALPSAKTNPEQKGLYEAFARGDVKTILQVPRKQRKQLFITDISSYFSYDLAQAGFGVTAMMRQGMRMGAATEQAAQGEQAALEAQGFMPRGPMDSLYAPAWGGVTTEAVKKAGFVVSIIGYSPYRDIRELLYPSGVQNQPQRWGFINRLSNLDKIVDGNSPFELFSGPTDVNHFILKTGSVELSAGGVEGRPSAMGVLDVTPSVAGGTANITFDRLIDPLTREVISRVPALNEHGEQTLDARRQLAYENNDYWFELDIKFVWKNAPAEPASALQPASLVPTTPAAPMAAPAGADKVPSLTDFTQ